MRTFLTTALVIAAALAGGAAQAATPGPTCRAACAPRIARDCGIPGIRGFGKCKRKLVRACKKTTPESACRVSPLGGPGNPPPDGGSSSNDDVVTRIENALANKLVSTGSSQFFSSGSITETDDMTLCGSHQVHLVVTTITSTSLNTFDSTETFDGTWSVQVDAGAATLELAVGEPQPRRFAVAVDAAGTVFIDGNEATVSDASGACGSGPGPGTPPGESSVEEITQALRDQVLLLEETNIGFGTRITAMVLCASGRYALEIDASVFPGVEVSTSGDWSVRLESTTPILDLAGENGQPTRSFTLGSDAAGNLTMNGIVAQVGDATLVPQVCPGL